MTESNSDRDFLIKNTQFSEDVFETFSRSKIKMIFSSKLISLSYEVYYFDAKVIFT